MNILKFLPLAVVTTVLSFPWLAAVQRSSDCHATSQSVATAMRSQFQGWFIAYNRGAESFGVNTVPLCGRIHPFDVSQANLLDAIPSFCEEDAHGFYDWLCFFDTAYSLKNNWPDKVTHGEVADSKAATQLSMWIGGPFSSPPTDVSDFVFNAAAYPEFPTASLDSICGPIKKFNGGIVYNASVPGLPEQFQIERNHAFTYNCGTIFAPFELTPGYWTFTLQICSDMPIRPGAPTRDSSLGGNDGWDNVRAQTQQACWWERSMVIEIKSHGEGPDFCCACDE